MDNGKYVAYFLHTNYDNVKLSKDCKIKINGFLLSKHILRWTEVTISKENLCYEHKEENVLTLWLKTPNSREKIMCFRCTKKNKRQES